MASLEEVSQYTLGEADRERLFALQRVCSVCWTTTDGTELGPDRTMTLKTMCTVHEDRATLEWFYEAFSKALYPDDVAAQQGLSAMLDTPRRVVLELAPVKIISYDGMKLAEAIAREGVTSS